MNTKNVLSEDLIDDLVEKEDGLGWVLNQIVVELMVEFEEILGRDDHIEDTRLFDLEHLL